VDPPVMIAFEDQSIKFSTGQGTSPKEIFSVNFFPGYKYNFQFKLKITYISKENPNWCFKKYERLKETESSITA
jgi:hypothetical protein